MAEEIPKDFGVRYVLWYAWLGLLGLGKFFWANAITILMILQAAFAALLLIADNPADPQHPLAGPLISHTVSRSIILANAILCAVLAQIKRSSPPPPEPPK
jgi:hypothetical protein